MSEKASSDCKNAPMKMADVSCSTLEYSFSAPIDKFDTDSFRFAMDLPNTATKGTGVCYPRDKANADYHVHFRWRILKKSDSIECEVRYVVNALGAEWDQDKKEPSAETIMAWLGHFFKFSDVSATVSADFLFRQAKRLTAFPLPIKTTIVDAGVDAEIDGVAVELSSSVNGVKRLFALQRKDELFVGLQSERRIEFSTFSIPAELILSKQAVDKFVR